MHTNLVQTTRKLDIYERLYTYINMTQNSSSGRPRSFDADQALRAAMCAFWASGYNATSYDDLERATKLRRQSLRYAFGDKRSLFRKALALYATERVDQVVALLERSGSPLRNIEAVFASWVEDAENHEQNGCLMVNTSGELGREDPDIAISIVRATDRLKRAFSKAFEEALELGEMRPDLDPHDLASLAVAAGDGALLHARASGDASDVARSLSALMNHLR